MQDELRLRLARRNNEDDFLERARILGIMRTTAYNIVKQREPRNGAKNYL